MDELEFHLDQIEKGRYRGEPTMSEIFVSAYDEPQAPEPLQTSSLDKTIDWVSSKVKALLKRISG